MCLLRVKLNKTNYRQPRKTDQVLLHTWSWLYLAALTEFCKRSSNSEQVRANYLNNNTFRQKDLPRSNNSWNTDCSDSSRSWFFSVRPENAVTAPLIRLKLMCSPSESSSPEFCSWTTRPWRWKQHAPSWLQRNSKESERRRHHQQRLWRLESRRCNILLRSTGVILCATGLALRSKCHATVNRCHIVVKRLGTTLKMSLRSTGVIFLNYTCNISFLLNASIRQEFLNMLRKAWRERERENKES